MLSTFLFCNIPCWWTFSTSALGVGYKTDMIADDWQWVFRSFCDSVGDRTKMTSGLAVCLSGTVHANICKALGLISATQNTQTKNQTKKQKKHKNILCRNLLIHSFCFLYKQPNYIIGTIRLIVFDRIDKVRAIKQIKEAIECLVCLKINKQVKGI